MKIDIDTNAQTLRITLQLGDLMSELNDALIALQSKVQSNSSAIQSAIDEIAKLRTQIAEGSLSPSALNDLAASLDSSAAALSAAIHQ